MTRPRWCGTQGRRRIPIRLGSRSYRSPTLVSFFLVRLSDGLSLEASEKLKGGSYGGPMKGSHSATRRWFQARPSREIPSQGTDRDIDLDEEMGGARAQAVTRVESSLTLPRFLGARRNPWLAVGTAREGHHCQGGGGQDADDGGACRRPRACGRWLFRCRGRGPRCGDRTCIADPRRSLGRRDRDTAERSVLVMPSLAPIAAASASS
jgi:hypothetical protein